MSRDLEPYACDACGKRRESDANRWWLIWETATPPRGTVGLVIEDWKEWRANETWVRHACGQACTQKLVERWLSTGSLEEPRPEGAVRP